MHFKYCATDSFPTFIQLVELLVTEGKHFTAVRQQR